MSFVYCFFIAFLLIFVSELGDKTQLIVLSFCNKLKVSSILFGVALGTFFSHGLAIWFGSSLGLINSDARFYLSFFTYLSFVIFGFFGFWHRDSEVSGSSGSKGDVVGRVSSSLKLHYCLIIAFSIFVGEFGDKTFLSSLGLGIEYPLYKFWLILGAVFGMVASNSVAILFGKFIGSKLNQRYIQILSNLLFVVFGALGFLKLFVFS